MPSLYQTDVRQGSTDSMQQKPGHAASTSSLDNVFGASSSFNSPQQQNIGTQYTQRISSTAAPRFSFSSGNDSESGGSPAPLSSRGSSVDPDGNDRPSFKRLPSQTLGPENAKRPFLGYGDEEERVSGWNITGHTTSQDNGDGTTIHNHTQNHSTLAPAPKMALGLGGLSHPDRVVASLAERRRRRMSAPSTSLTPLDPNAVPGKNQQQAPPEMKLPSLGYAPQATGGMAG
jgi:hypothetical protein